MSSINATQFQFFQSYLRQASGYHLLEEKKYLLDARLSTVLMLHKIDDIEQLVSILRRGGNHKLSRDVVESMTVNETLFFRNPTVFDTISGKLIPLLQGCPIGKISIWSAACSTGQEPYSLAMLLADKKHECPQLAYAITASDINASVIEKAKRGIFTDIEVNRGLTEHYKKKYFTRADDKWHIADNIKQSIHFRQLNLAETLDLPGPFDLVLLRNVLIYFDQPLRDSILKKIAQIMRPGGYLLLGGAEAIHGKNPHFTRCNEAIELYQYQT